MKKKLLLGIVCLSFISFTGNAQSFVRSNVVTTADIQLSEDSETNSSFEKDLNTEMLIIGAASNIYTTLDATQNQVHYNADLDVVTFIHRQNNASWPDGGSGVVRYDISMDGGATWEIDKILTPMMVDSNSTGGIDDGIHVSYPDGDIIIYGYRYPSGALFTPPGGTIEDSYYIGMGPAIAEGDIPYSIWTHVFFGSQKMDGSVASDEQLLQALTIPDSLYHTDYMGRGLVTGGDHVYAMSTNWNADALYNLSKYVFWKGSVNDADDGIDWEPTVMYPDWKLDAATSAPIVNGNISVAFSSDGSVGYMIIGGCLEGYSGDVERPVVYKTTDNGDSWVLQAELDIIGSETGVALLDRPYFRDFDCVVDLNGDLHVFAEMMQYGEDFATFDYAGYMTNFTLSNSDNTWSELIVGNIENTNSGGYIAGFQDQFTHPQASVSENGEKLFLCWLTSVDADDNDQPDIFARGVDVTNNTWTEVKNLTIDTDAEGVAAYATLSPVSITNGDDFDYELPYVCVPDYAGELEETFFAYLKGIGFDEAEFVAMSIDNIEKDMLSFELYPNPASNYSSVSFSLINQAHVSLSLYNSLGQKVSQFDEVNLGTGPHKLDINTSQYKGGLYFVELNVNGNSISSRLLIAE